MFCGNEFNKQLLVLLKRCQSRTPCLGHHRLLTHSWSMTLFSLTCLLGWLGFDSSVLVIEFSSDGIAVTVLCCCALKRIIEEICVISGSSFFCFSGIVSEPNRSLLGSDFCKIFGKVGEKRGPPKGSIVKEICR